MREDAISWLAMFDPFRVNKETQGGFDEEGEDDDERQKKSSRLCAYAHILRPEEDICKKQAFTVAVIVESQSISHARAKSTFKPCTRKRERSFSLLPSRRSVFAFFHFSLLFFFYIFRTNKKKAAATEFPPPFKA